MPFKCESSLTFSHPCPKLPVRKVGSARGHASIVPNSEARIINGIILDLSAVAAMFRPFHLAEKWNAAKCVLAAASGFRCAISSIDALQNTNGPIQELIPSNTTFSERHLAEKVARGCGMAI